jgi:hypothetical protein
MVLDLGIVGANRDMAKGWWGWRLVVKIHEEFYIVQYFSPVWVVVERQMNNNVDADPSFISNFAGSHPSELILLQLCDPLYSQTRRDRFALPYIDCHLARIVGVIGKLGR